MTLILATSQVSSGFAGWGNTGVVVQPAKLTEYCEMDAFSAYTSDRQELVLPQSAGDLSRAAKDDPTFDKVVSCS